MKNFTEKVIKKETYKNETVGASVQLTMTEVVENSIWREGEISIADQTIYFYDKQAFDNSLRLFKQAFEAYENARKP